MLSLLALLDSKLKTTGRGKSLSEQKYSQLPSVAWFSEILSKYKLQVGLWLLIFLNPNAAKNNLLNQCKTLQYL